MRGHGMHGYWLLLGALALSGCDDGGGGAGGEVDMAAMGGAGGGEGGAGGEGGGPVPEGFSIPGLAGDMTARFDAAGILHVECSDDPDCFAAQGYFHAAHRFIQMDIRRRFVRGRLSEMVGVATLDVDKDNRFRIAGRSGERVEERIWGLADARTRAAIEAYTRGVNAWLYDYRNGRNGAVLNAEYDFTLINKDAITDWEPLDSAACILALIRQLTDHSDEEMIRGAIFSRHDPAIAMDFYGLAPASSATVLPASKRGGPAFAPWQLDSLHARMAQARSVLTQRPTRVDLWSERAAIGSNNWVLGASRSADGRTLLANDPHLGMSNPAVWYLVNLDAKRGGGTLHVAGASFAGLPGVILGQNEDIAWGATTTYFDLADVYIEALSPDGEGVMFNGEKVPFVKQTHVFKVDKAPDAVEERLYVPHHGPVVAIDREAGTAMTVRWTGQDTSTDLNFMMAMNYATSAAEAKAAIGSTITTVGQNFIFMDRAGDIGWFPYNTIPRRPWASAELPSWLPIPGDGSAEWDGYLDPSAVPQAMNPPSGYIATANNDMTGALHDGDPTNDGLPMLQHFVSPGYRQERIIERIEARPTHDLASMQAIQADVRSLLGERVVPALLGAVNGVALSDPAQQVVNALAAWDFECTTGLDGTDPEESPKSPTGVASSVGCAAFHVLWPRLVRLTLLDEADPDVNLAPNPSAFVRLLLSPGDLAYAGSYWDDRRTDEAEETKADQIAAALDSAGRWLAAQLGPDSDDWRWGRIHTLTLRADLFSAAGVNLYDSPAFANDGGLYTVDAAHPTRMFADGYGHESGPSMRFACAASGERVECTIDLPGGQRHHQDSPNYSDLLEKHLQNAPTPFPFTVAEVTAVTVETVTFAPR